MKILMLSTDANILKEGSAVRARMIEYGTLVDELHIILSSVGGKSGPIKISGNVFVHPSASVNTVFSRLSFFSPSNLIPADLVTAQDPFETGFAAWYISKRIDAKLEIQIHTDFLSPYFKKEYFINRIRVLIARFVLPKADGIRVVSQRIIDSLKAKSYKLKAVPMVLPIFVDIEKIRKTEPKINLREKYPQFDFIFLMASRLSREKNIGLAIEAMREIVKKHPKAGLIIVGSGPEEQKLKLLTTTYLPTGQAGNLQPNVVFEDWTNDVVSYMKTADVFLNTSNYEGFGLTLAEAAASDCPIISTNVGVVGSILRNKEEALICSPKDVRCFSAGLERLIAYPGLRKEITLRAQTAIEPLAINKDKFPERIKEAWEKTISSKKL